jgi:alanine dehydrogenase
VTDGYLLFLNQADVRELLDLPECIAAVASAFRAHAQGNVPIAPGILGAHIGEGGFHVKTAALGGTPAYFATKINANFPGNPSRFGLPAIQGLIALFEAGRGTPLAVMDSIEITILRTAAASAVAATHLARPDAAILTICGCGNQGRSHLRALLQVRPIRQVFAFDTDPERAERFARELGDELRLDIRTVRTLDEAVPGSDICVTCTPARAPILSASLLRPGLFIAAVGADNPDKQELEPGVLLGSTVVVDILEQAATIGELHHAIAAGVMGPADVHAELGQIVAGLRPGRMSEEEVFVFDSTGTALQDVAAASLVYERALRLGRGHSLPLAS